MAPVKIRDMYPSWALGGIFYNIVHTNCDCIEDPVCEILNGFFDQKIRMVNWERLFKKN